MSTGGSPRPRSRGRACDPHANLPVSRMGFRIHAMQPCRSHETEGCLSSAVRIDAPSEGQRCGLWMEQRRRVHVQGDGKAERNDGEDVFHGLAEGEIRFCFDSCKARPSKGHWNAPGRQGAPIFLRHRSTAIAIPIPPPMHRLAMPRLKFLSSMRCSSVTSTRAPLAPIGCPSAIAPPR